MTRFEFVNENNDSKDKVDVSKYLIDQEDDSTDVLDSDQDDVEKFYKDTVDVDKERSEMDNKKWAHISCINWTANMNYLDDEQYVCEGALKDYQKGQT